MSCCTKNDEFPRISSEVIERCDLTNGPSLWNVTRLCYGVAVIIIRTEAPPLNHGHLR
jgi:hypothetical protein